MVGGYCRVLSRACDLTRLFAFKNDHSGLVWEVELGGCRDMGEKSVGRGHGSRAKVAAVGMKKKG